MALDIELTRHRLTLDSEPQPDVILLRYRDDFYRERKVGAVELAHHHWKDHSEI